MALGKSRGKLSAAQKKKFDDIFPRLIRLIAYPKSGAFLKTADTTLKAHKVQGGKAQVPQYVEVAEEDFEVDVVYFWEKKKDWLLVDVSFDGAPLTKDYQNQFARIIKKDGADGLLAKLDKRLKEEIERVGVE